MKFARYDSTAVGPTPVLDWLHVFDENLDPDGYQYSVLPPATDLLQITDAQWAVRETTPYIENGVLISVPIAIQLTNTQMDKISQLFRAYQTAVYAPISFKTAGNITATFQAGMPSIADLNYMLQAYTPAGATPAGFYWVAEDNTQIPFTLADLQGLAKSIGDRGWAAFQHMQAKKADVMAAATAADVLAIIW